MAVYFRCAVVLLAGAAWTATAQHNGFAPGTDFDYRPFGSNRPCSALVNETLAQRSGQIIIERVLATADTMSNSFSSSGSPSQQEIQQLNTWASQVCGQMQNAVGYLKTVCQYSASNNAPTEAAAQLKVRAMSVARDYLCNNDAVALKEMAINNGAQCVRWTTMPDFGCRSVPGAPSPTGLGLDTSARFATAFILGASTYSSEPCRYINDLTNCIREKYSRSPDFCSPRVTAHIGRIISLMLQTVQCTAAGGNFPAPTLPPFPNFNFNGFNNQHSGSFNYPSFDHQFNSNNNNQFNSGRYPQHGSGNVPHTSNDFGGSFSGSERRSSTIPPWNSQRRTNGAPNSQGMSVLVVVMALASYLTF